MITPLASLLANVATWTDKEVLIAIASVVAALVPVVGFILKYTTGLYRRKARRIELEKQKVDVENEDLKRQIEDKERDKDLGIKAAESRVADAVKVVEAQRDEALAEVHRHKTDLAAEHRRIQRALNKDGQTWTERVLHNAPEFKGLDPENRPTPIISVLNLKGGVGKTTITANLGAALDNRGYRVLLVDLDLQGSLTSLYLTYAEQEVLAKEGKLLADFLEASFEADHPNMLNFTRHVLSDQKSGLVPTTDGLVYAETNLTIRWLLREEGNRDPRFLLRKELHMRRITNDYDIVLLDCPPVINICCVNALAASDYLLVPIQPSKQATSRVPVLLKRLKEFRENINSELRVLGILNNRTLRSELTYEEENRLSELRSICKDVWGSEVPLLDTFIRTSKEIRTAEDGHRPLSPDEEPFQAFDDLAQEVVNLLPTYIQTRVTARLAERAAKEVAS